MGTRGRKLTDKNTSSKKGERLVKADLKFKMAISITLDNNYCFKQMRKSGLQKLDQFIKETVGKHLTISKVDDLFLRTKGPVKSKETIEGISRDVVHYGKDRSPFRIHGFTMMMDTLLSIKSILIIQNIKNKSA